MRKIKKCPLDILQTPSLKDLCAESKGLTCKEKGCNSKIPQGKSLISLVCQALGYCRYCYRMYFPRRKRINLPALRQGSERLLSWHDKRRRERRGFNPMLWSPKFRKQMLDYWQAKERGEVRI